MKTHELAKLLLSKENITVTIVDFESEDSYANEIEENNILYIDTHQDTRICVIMIGKDDLE